MSSGFTLAPVTQAGLKRQLDFATEGHLAAGGRLIPLQRDRLEVSDGLFSLYNSIVSPTNPQMSVMTGPTDGQRLLKQSMAMWIIQNPLVLETVTRTTLDKSRHPIFKLFPIEYTEAGVYKKSIVIFNCDPIRKSVRKTVTNFITSSVETIEGRNVIHSEGFITDLKTLGMPGGVDLLAANIKKVIGDILCAVILNATNAFFATVPFARTPEQLFPNHIPPEDVEKAYRERRRRFARINKEPQGVQKIINDFTWIMEQEAGPCARVVVTSAVANFIKHGDATNTEREFSGYAALVNNKDVTPDASSRVPYTAVEQIALPYLIRGIHNNDEESVFRDKVACGSFWRFLFAFSDVSPKDYRTTMSNTETVSWESDTFDTYTTLGTLRNDVHFIPFNRDIDRSSGGGRNPNEGMIDYAWLETIANEPMFREKQSYYHERTKTTYAKCPDDLDMLLNHNKYKKSPDELDFYAIYAMGELKECKTPTLYLKYIFESLYERVVEGLTEQQTLLYAKGIQLMKVLASPENVGNVNSDVERVKVKNGINGYEYYVPNRWGGPNFIQNGFDLSRLDGLGTVAGFLTIKNSTTRAMANNVATYKVSKVGSASLTVANALDIERLDVIYGFLDVLEHLVKKIRIIDPTNAAVDANLLPGYHKHPDMNPLHASMIVASYFLCGAFLYPLTLATSTEINTGSANTTSTMTQPTKEPIKQNEVALNHLIRWRDNRIFRTFAKLDNIRQINDNKDHLKTLLGEIVSAKTKSKTSSSRLSAARQKDIIADYLSKTGITVVTIEELEDHLTELFHEINNASLIDSISYIVELYQLQDSSQINENARLLRLTVNDMIDGLTNSSVNPLDATSIHVASDKTNAVNFTLGVIQYHVNDASVRNSSVTDRRGLWRAGISALNMGGKIKFMIDQERIRETKGVLFDEEYSKAFSGTLMTAGSFIHENIPPTPCSGYFTTNTDPHFDVQVSGEISTFENRSKSRYATGYPVTELLQGKVDSETRAFSEYHNRIFRLNSRTKITKDFELTKDLLTTNKIEKVGGTYVNGKGKIHITLPRFFIHGLCFPYTGHPESKELTDFEARWIQTHNEDPIRGFVSRAGLMASPNLHLVSSFSSHNIPIPYFPLIFRLWETQYMNCVVGTTAGNVGNVFFDSNGIDKIVSYDPTQQELRSHYELPSAVLLHKFQNFSVATEASGDQHLGGCGHHFINEGLSRSTNADKWKDLQSKLALGEKLGNNSNISVLQSFVAATSPRPPKLLDARGGYKSGDFARDLPANCIDFIPLKTEPMYESCFVTNEAFKFSHLEVPHLASDQMSSRNIAKTRLYNYVGAQYLQRIYSHRTADNKRYIDSHHLWGDYLLPGFVDYTQSNSKIRIDHHFEGRRFEYMHMDTKISQIAQVNV